MSKVVIPDIGSFLHAIALGVRPTPAGANHRVLDGRLCLDFGLCALAPGVSLPTIRTFGWAPDPRLSIALHTNQSSPPASSPPGCASISSHFRSARPTIGSPQNSPSPRLASTRLFRQHLPESAYAANTRVGCQLHRRHLTSIVAAGEDGRCLNRSSVELSEAFHESPR
jgi:hypothetical protein